MNFDQCFNEFPGFDEDARQAAALFWNKALEEAAKAADAEVKLAQDMKRMCQNDPGVWRYSEARERTASELARAIRAMQTTAGAGMGGAER